MTWYLELQNAPGQIAADRNEGGRRAANQIAAMCKHGGAVGDFKSGLVGLTQALAEFGPRGFRFNAILPEAVDTEIYRAMNDTAERQAFITGLHALKSTARPEELARSALYLASDDAAFVTGTAARVSGGASIT
jgi:NAD(P)-dependent dehydrogenase (short-subunit alcohol dehydrogenase family)